VFLTKVAANEFSSPAVFWAWILARQYPWLGRLIVFLSTSRKIWENIRADLPILKWENIS